MLFVNLQRDDYVMIGDVRVRYVRNRGSKTFTIEILTPDGVPVTRDIQYETKLAESAAEGNAQAQYLLEKVQEEKEHRRKLTAVRRAKHQAQAQP
jgi:hypothetical protein